MANLQCDDRQMFTNQFHNEFGITKKGFGSRHLSNVLKFDWSLQT